MKYLVILIVTLTLLLEARVSQAQRFAYVDTEYILEHVPEYQRAQRQLRSSAEDWRDQIRRQREAIRDAKRDFEAEKVLLPEETREQRKKDIQDMEVALERYREEKFGPEGELYSKRDQLIQPIKDRVFDAVQEVARDGALDFVFDRAGAVTMLYYGVQYDRSDEVLKKMGIDPLDERDKEEDKGNIPDTRDKKDTRERPRQGQPGVRPERAVPADENMIRPDGTQELPEGEYQEVKPLEPD